MSISDQLVDVCNLNLISTVSDSYDSLFRMRFTKQRKRHEEHVRCLRQSGLSQVEVMIYGRSQLLEELQTIE